ncbi:ABC transporter [Thermococcus sp. P6]|uniref:ABC transporter ATP-binding protein n=1 Tax=Thermococcus sp. P6 TaxID=122420 RepID=UPI000B59C6D5|nr:ABC transporter ATP-binding protein [Thermococcus sp. P6]ASJ10550.1 ABC transporter [Thermococcus sp. P6]
MITARKLTKRFGKLVALNSVDLEIGDGLTLILGPNGGGKSTFLNLCAGLYRPSEGEIKVFGENPWSNDRLRRRMGFSFDPPALPKHRTAREWLGYLAEVKGLDEDEILRAAELFSAAGYLDRKMGEYSAGMLKRVSLAQAFLGKPRLVLLDEPLANLDLSGICEVAKIIGEQAERGTNMLVVSHIWRPLVEFADRLVVIAAGRVALTGTPEEVIPQIEGI